MVVLRQQLWLLYLLVPMSLLEMTVTANNTSKDDSASSSSNTIRALNEPPPLPDDFPEFDLLFQFRKESSSLQSCAKNGILGRFNEMLRIHIDLYGRDFLRMAGATRPGRSSTRVFGRVQSLNRRTDRDSSSGGGGDGGVRPPRRTLRPTRNNRAPVVISKCPKRFLGTTTTKEGRRIKCIIGRQQKQRLRCPWGVRKCCRGAKRIPSRVCGCSHGEFWKCFDTKCPKKCHGKPTKRPTKRPRPSKRPTKRPTSTKRPRRPTKRPPPRPTKRPKKPTKRPKKPTKRITRTKRPTRKPRTNRPTKRIKRTKRPTRKPRTKRPTKPKRPKPTKRPTTKRATKPPRPTTSKRPTNKRTTKRPRPTRRSTKPYTRGPPSRAATTMISSCPSEFPNKSAGAKCTKTLLCKFGKKTCCDGKVMATQFCKCTKNRGFFRCVDLKCSRKCNGQRRRLMVTNDDDVFSPSSPIASTPNFVPTTKIAVVAAPPATTPLRRPALAGINRRPTIRKPKKPTKYSITTKKPRATKYPTKKPTKINFTKRPTKMKRTKKPTKMKRTKRPTKMKRTKMPTKMKRTKRPTKTKRTKKPTKMKRTKRPTKMKRTKKPTKMKRTKRPTNKKRTTKKPTKKKTKTPTNRRIHKFYRPFSGKFVYYSGTVGCSACGREVTDRLSAPSDSQQVMERFISKQLTAVAQGWVQKNGIQGGCDLRDDEFRIFFEIVGKFNRNIFSGISKDGLAKVKDFLGE